MKLRTSQAIAWAVILGACAASIALNMAHAAGPPQLTFTAVASPGTVPGEVVTKLTWDTLPLATQCTASGDTAWTGAKAPSGTVTLDQAKPPRTYSLRCNWPGDTSAKLTWTPPTQNTDGSALQNLAGYRILYGTSATALGQTIQVPNPGVSTYTVDNLTAGAWFFSVRVYSSTGAESVNSNVATKTIAAPFEITQSVGVTTPNPATNLAAQ